MNLYIRLVSSGIFHFIFEIVTAKTGVFLMILEKSALLSCRTWSLNNRVCETSQLSKDWIPNQIFHSLIRSDRKFPDNLVNSWLDRENRSVVLAPSRNYHKKGLRPEWDMEQSAINLQFWKLWENFCLKRRNFLMIVLRNYVFLSMFLPKNH